MTYIVEKIVGDEIKFDDLDIDLCDVTGDDYPDEGIEVLYDESKLSIGRYKEGDFLPIDKLVETAKKLKDDGATHVQIMYHCDHHGYYFNGSQLTPADDESIQIVRSKLVEEANNLRKRMNRLNDEILNIQRRGNFIKEQVEEIDSKTNK